MISVVGIEGMCGGTVYNSRTIVTAAHCCKGAEDNGQRMEIVAGTNYFFTMDESHLSNVSHYLIHPDYNETLHTNDVCLLFVDEDLVFNDNLKSMELNENDVAADTECVVSGWGSLYVRTYLPT